MSNAPEDIQAIYEAAVTRLRDAQSPFWALGLSYVQELVLSLVQGSQVRSKAFGSQLLGLLSYTKADGYLAGAAHLAATLDTQEARDALALLTDNSPILYAQIQQQYVQQYLEDKPRLDHKGRLESLLNALDHEWNDAIAAETQGDTN